MSDKEASGERSPAVKPPESEEDKASRGDDSPGVQTPQRPASPSTGGSSKTTSSSGLTTPCSMSLAGELSLTSGDLSTSKSGDRSTDTSPTSQWSVSPKSPQSKRQRRSSIAFAKKPTIHPVPARSRSAPVSPPGSLSKVKTAVEEIGTRVKKMMTKKKRAPPVNTWMKEVKTKRYRCVCGKLFNWGECPSSLSEAGPSSTGPAATCDSCGTAATLADRRSPSGPAPLADVEDLSSSEEEEGTSSEPQVSIVVEPPSDEESFPEEPEDPSVEEASPMERSPEEVDPEDPQSEEAPSEERSQGCAPEPPSDEKV